MVKFYTTTMTKLAMTVAAGILVTAGASSANAAGYELLEQSAKGVGQAFSGASTGYGDGSEAFFNPAALSELEKQDTFSMHGHLIVPSADFNNQGSALAPQLGGAALSGNMGGDGGKVAYVPNIYVAHKFNDWVSAGLGLNSPFGLASEYNDDWVGRYHAVESELEIMNVNPALSIKAAEWLSLGVSMQAMYADARLTNAVDFGTIGVSSLGLPTASALGLLPQQADGFARVEGDDWGYGMGIGALIMPLDSVRVGVSYRSSVELDLKGSAKFTVPSNALPLTSTGLFQDSNARASVNLPETITAGVAVDMTDDFTMYLDGAWINWSRFDELRVEFDSLQPDSVQAEEWDDTVRLSMGGRYSLNDCTDLRAGFTWDESPISSDELRTPRIPDNDRYWVALGLDHEMWEDVTLSLNYAHLFIPDADTRNLTTSTGNVLNGSWDLSVDIVSASLTAVF